MSETYEVPNRLDVYQLINKRNGMFIRELAEHFDTIPAAISFVVYDLDDHLVNRFEIVEPNRAARKYYIAPWSNLCDESEVIE